MLIHWIYVEAADVAVLAPAWYDVLWSVTAVLVGLVPLAALVWLVTRLVRGAAAPAPSEAARVARRHATAVSALSWTALTVTLVVGLATVAARPVDLTQGLLYAVVPAAAGAVLAAVQTIGELTWPRPAGTVRRAPLVRRTALDVAPRGLLRLSLGWVAALAVVLTAGGLISESGRDVTRTFPGGSSAAGPFPGWFYGGPLLVATVVVVLVTAAALRLIARRPAVSDTATDWDMGLRRLSAHRLLRGSQLVLGLTLAGVLLVAGVAVRNVGTGGGLDETATGSTGHVAVGIALVVLGIATLLGALAAATIPAPTPAAGATADRDAAPDRTEAVR